jgi:hypothetical protein
MGEIKFNLNKLPEFPEIFKVDHNGTKWNTAKKALTPQEQDAIIQYMRTADQKGGNKDGEISRGELNYPGDLSGVPWQARQVFKEWAKLSAETPSVAETPEEISALDEFASNLAKDTNDKPIQLRSSYITMGWGNGLHADGKIGNWDFTYRKVA